VGAPEERTFQIACARRAAASEETIIAIAGARVAVIPRSTTPSIAGVQDAALSAKKVPSPRSARGAGMEEAKFYKLLLIEKSDHIEVSLERANTRESMHTRSGESMHTRYYFVPTYPCVKSGAVQMAGFHHRTPRALAFSGRRRKSCFNRQGGPRLNGPGRLPRTLSMHEFPTWPAVRNRFKQGNRIRAGLRKSPFREAELHHIPDEVGTRFRNVATLNDHGTRTGGKLNGDACAPMCWIGGAFDSDTTAVFLD